MVDAEIVNRRLRELDRRLGELARLHQGATARAYAEDLALQAQVERHLQLAIQAAIDLAAHIAAQDSAETPEDYGDTFPVVARLGVIDDALADRLRLAAGMRNVLVHGYAEIDHAIVWASLDDLDDLRALATGVAGYLSSH